MRLPIQSPLAAVLHLLLLPLSVASAEPLNVTGGLVDELGRPLVDAEVSLLPAVTAFQAGWAALEGRPPAEPVASVACDEHGRFTLVAPSPGAYEVAARLVGRLSVRLGPILLAESQELPPGILMPAVETTFVVRDPSGSPVGGAWVLALEESSAERARPRREDWRLGARSAHSGPDGRLRLPVREGESLDLVGVAPSGAVGRWLGARSGDLRLEAPSLVRRGIQVTTEDGMPVIGALIAWAIPGAPVGLTDLEGRIPLPSLPRQSRLVVATSDGRRQLHRLTGTMREEQIALTGPGRVQGRVVDALTGRPVSSALILPESEPALSTRVDADGRFQLAVVELRDLWLEVTAPGYLLQRARVTSAELRTGRSPAIALAPAAAVSGEVVGLDGRPVEGVSLAAVAESALGPRSLSPRDPVTSRAASDPRGRFLLPRLASGVRYEVRAAKEGHLPAARMVIAGPAARQGPANAVRLTLAPARELTGQVVDQLQRPLAEVMVTVLAALRPEADASVEVMPEAASAGGAPPLRTDRSGRFVVAASPAAEVDLSLTRSGFAPGIRRRIRVAAGTGPLDLGVFVLRPGGALHGQVVSEKGRPVPGAELFLLERPPKTGEVEAIPRGRQNTHRTDSAGRFRVEDLPVGVPRHLLVRAAGHVPGVFVGLRPPSQDPLILRLDPAYELTGRVLDEGFAGVEGARVQVAWQAVLEGDPTGRMVGKPVFRYGESGPDGRFSVAGLPLGPARLNVAKSGFRALEDVPVAAPWPADAAELVLVLERGAILTGQVTDSNRKAVGDARVATLDASTRTDAEGVFRLEGVALGAQRVLVSHRHYSLSEQRVEVQPGENRLDVVLPAGVEVSGRVVDERGESVAGVRLRLLSLDRRAAQEHETSSDQDGRFLFRPVARGRYGVRAETAELAAVDRPEPVVVEGEPVQGVEVVLPGGARLTGRILGLELDELPGVRLEAFDAEGRGRPASVDAEGRYELRSLAGGDWHLLASLWGGQRRAEARVAVGPGDSDLRQDLEFRQRATLTGRVLYEDEALPGTAVSVRGQRFSIERSIETGFDGAFRLEDLEPDTYWLGLANPSKLLVHNQDLELAGDREIEIRLEPGSLAGRVTGATTGQAIAGAQVILRHLPGPEGPEFLVGGGSEEDGRFLLQRVPPAAYQLEVSAEGFVPFQQAVQVQPGDASAEVAVALEAASGLQLQVHLSTGEVPPLLHLLAVAPGGQAALAETRAVAADGRVSVSKLPPGAWQLYVGAPGAVVVPLQVTVPGEAPPLTLPKGGQLALRVPALLTSDRSAGLSLLGADQQPFWTLGLGGTIQQQWPVQAGKARVEGLPTGTWWLRVEASDGRVWVGSATTVEGTDIEIQLD